MLANRDARGCERTLLKRSERLRRDVNASRGILMRAIMFGGDVIESQVKTAVFWELKRVT